MDIAVIIYWVSLFIFLCFALLKEISGDQKHEFHVFCRALERGILWESLVSSCLFSILVPYFIVKTFHLKKEIVFRITPCFFYALAPAFIYLIARNFLSVEYSLMAGGFAVANSFFVYNPNEGRVSVAMGILAVMVWAFLSGYVIIATFLAVLLVLSYYAVSYYALFIFGLAWAFFFLRGSYSIEFVSLPSIVIALLFTIFVWHVIIAKKPGNIFKYYIKRVVSFSELKARHGIEAKPQWMSSGFFGKQEPVVQVAFGKGFRKLSIIRKIEFFTSWMLVVVMMSGMGIAIFSNMVSGYYMCFSILAVVIILLSIANQYISRIYGTSRFYLFGMVFLAPYFAIVSRELNAPIIFWGLLGLHILIISGLLHRIFGKRKELDYSFAGLQ